MQKMTKGLTNINATIQSLISTNDNGESWFDIAEKLYYDEQYRKYFIKILANKIKENLEKETKTDKFKNTYLLTLLSFILGIDHITIDGINIKAINIAPWPLYMPAHIIEFTEYKITAIAIAGTRTPMLPFYSRMTWKNIKTIPKNLFISLSSLIMAVSPNNVGEMADIRAIVSAVKGFKDTSLRLDGYSLGGAIINKILCHIDNKTNIASSVMNAPGVVSLKKQLLIIIPIILTATFIFQPITIINLMWKTSLAITVTMFIFSISVNYFIPLMKLLGVEQHNKCSISDNLVQKTNPNIINRIFMTVIQQIFWLIFLPITIPVLVCSSIKDLLWEHSINFSFCHVTEGTSAEQFNSCSNDPFALIGDNNKYIWQNPQDNNIGLCSR